jgi:hypothetical protein
MCRPPLFRRYLRVAMSVPFKECRYWEATSQVRDSVGISEEDISPQTPIIGVQGSIDSDAANDDGPKDHEFENMIKHRNVSSLRASELRRETNSICRRVEDFRLLSASA